MYQLSSNYITLPIRRNEDFKKVERLFKIVSQENLGYLAGGFARYLCSPRHEPSPYRDIDVFTNGEESFHKLKAILMYRENLEIKIETNMSVTFKTSLQEAWKDCPMINLVKPQKNNKLLTYGNTLEEILDNFDFSICRAGILSSEECLVDYHFLRDEQKKKLRIMKMESPIACMARIIKYSGKGYKISIPEIVEIFKEWNERGKDYHSKIFNALDNLYKDKMGGYSRAHCFGYPDSIEEINNDIMNKEIDFESPLVDRLVTVDDDDNLYDLIKIG